MDSFEYDLCLNVEKKFQGNCHQYTQYEGMVLSKYEKSVLHELPRSRLLRISKMLKNIKRPSKPQPTIVRRQFTRPRRRNKKTPPKLPPTGRNALQMSLLLLSILAFGTFIATTVMRNMRKNNRREHSTYKIIINKTPRMQEQPASDNKSFGHWASIFIEGITEFIGEISDELR